MKTRTTQMGINPINLALPHMAEPRLKVWWIPQVPMTSFDVFVSSFAHAKVLLEALAQYDLFQLDNNIKPDYSNAGGLCIWNEDLEADDCGGKWEDWENNQGEGFDELSLSECVALDQHYAKRAAG